MTEIIESDSALKAWTDKHLANAESIAIDVESDGLFRYRGRLCTLQIATREDATIIDTLAEAVTLAPLRELLSASGPRTLLHDSSLDVRLLADAGINVGNVFDTSVAARFIGETATGLGNQLEKHLGVKLAKEKQHADWGRRPIAEEDTAYLLNDVIYLHRLQDVLIERAQTLGIVEEILEESRYLVERAIPTPTPPPLWRRPAERERLGSRPRSILREIMLVRDTEAQEQDVPAHRVLANEVLLEITRRAPDSQRALHAIRGARSPKARHLTDALLEAVARGADRGDVPADEKPDRKMLTPDERRARRRVEQSLSAWRRAEAEKREVDAQVVLPGHCLHAVAALDVQSKDDLGTIAGFGTFRVERYGSAIIETLRKARLSG